MGLGRLCVPVAFDSFLDRFYRRANNNRGFAIMKIVKNKEIITISHNGEEVRFDQIPTQRKRQGPEPRDSKGVVLTADRLLFSELNRYWGTLTQAEQDELFGAYTLLSELAVEGDEVISEHAPKVMEIIAKHHKAERFRELYPLKNVFIPQKLHASIADMSPNYTESMTYFVPDYYHLMILTLLIKPFIPVFAVLGAYVAGKGISQEAKRKVVYKINLAFDLLSDTEIRQSEAVQKLELFLPSLVEKFQKEMSNRGSGTSLSILSSVMGYGSDMMDEYLLSLTIVRLLALRPCYCDFPDGSLEDSSIVSSIYFGIRTEVESGFANRIAGQQVILKQHPTAVVFNGEKGKVSAIDLVQGRSPAPIKEYVRPGMTFKDYRRFIKTSGYDIAPANAKCLIDSQIANHTGPTYELHEWLAAAALHRFADHRSFKDIDPDKFPYGVGLAQAIYLYYGMPQLAQLLSCEMLPGNISGYPIEPIDSELKISTDRYYPQAYRSPRNESQESIVRTSLELLVRNHLNPYHFHLKASPEAAELLKCEPDIPNYRPHGRILTQLTEFLAIQARQKVSEVKWFNS